jgi:hypothetical protein
MLVILYRLIQALQKQVTESILLESIFNLLSRNSSKGENAKDIQKTNV